MYVKQVTIKNIRAIESFDWEISSKKYAGWHVIIGDNGSGKSSVLRSIALALTGPTEAIALRQDWNNWLRREEQQGRVVVYIEPDQKLDQYAGKGAKVKNYYLSCGVAFRRDAQQGVIASAVKYKRDPARHIWSGKPGWFAASYGPFRRFAGGDKDAEKLFYSNPRLARHLSIFGESVALSESLSWLQNLQFKKLEAIQAKEPADHPDIRLVQYIEAFINQSGFLPHDARIEEITSKAVTFVDGNGRKIPVEELSDGYRSILSMTFELIRQLVAAYDLDTVFARQDPTENIKKIIAPGVVLIDEIDAHLHPTWQRRIGGWLCEHFPRIQFIVTTHSPLVCHPGPNNTVYRLPQPGSDSDGGMLQGKDLDRLFYGNVLDAYGTGAFGDDITRSAAGHERLERLAVLNQKELRSTLTAAEKREQERLRRALPTSAHVLED